jgi:hypothetical protein
MSRARAGRETEPHRELLETSSKIRSASPSPSPPDRVQEPALSHPEPALLFSASSGYSCLMNVTSIRILPSLPAYGPLAEPFPSDGAGAHREGLVVEFTCEDGPAWSGNFQRGLSSFDAVFTTFGADRPLIIAGGTAYLLDVASRREVEEFGGGIPWGLELEDRKCLVLSNGCDFEARARHGVIWRSGRVSWDGMRDLTHRGDKLFGSAYSPIDDDYTAFVLDLNTGRFTGGSYVQREVRQTSSLWREVRRLLTRH